MLTILPRRGPDAFNAFYDILVVLKEGSAADILKPELAVERRNKERINYAAGQRPQQPSGVTSPTDDDDDDDNLPESKISVKPIRSFIHPSIHSFIHSRSEMLLRGKSVRSWCDGSLDRSFMGWTHLAISHSSQCSTTGVTKAVVCIILSVR